MGDPKAEAERLYEIGERYFHQGNREKARNFLERAEKLHSSKKIRDLLNQITNGNNRGASSARSRTTSSSNGHQNTEQQNESDSRPEYTPEQLSEVQRIQRCKDYYEILQVEKSGTFDDEEVKRAYRKLAMKLHPDKNKAPGATEAFRAVSNAFAVLSDAQKRRQYDLQGPGDDDHSTMRDGPAAHSHGARRRYAQGGTYFYEYDFSRGFESDMSAEDIFNMFFGGGLFGDDNNVHVYQNGERAQRRERMHRTRVETSNHLLWIQIAPFIALIAISFLSNVFRSSPPFSLSQTASFSESRETSNLRVKYFVKSDFIEQYGERIGTVEQEVENEYYNILRTKCYNEQAYRDSAMYRARLYGDATAYKNARDMALPNCNEINRIHGYA